MTRLVRFLLVAPLVTQSSWFQECVFVRKIFQIKMLASRNSVLKKNNSNRNVCCACLLRLYSEREWPFFFWLGWNENHSSVIFPFAFDDTVNEKKWLCLFSGCFYSHVVAIARINLCGIITNDFPFCISSFKINNFRYIYVTYIMTITPLHSLI